MLKVRSESVREQENFLMETVTKRGYEVVASQIISSIVKDEQPVKLKSGVTLEMKCDLCKGPITTNRPYNIKVGTSSYYFCCKTCRRSYLDKHRPRMEAAKSRAKRLPKIP
jgi:YHS domain-containing protein